MNNLKKFQTEADYTAATLNYPAVSWVTATDNVYFDKSAPTTSFSGLTVYYNITDTSQPTLLFNDGSSGSGSGSGSGGALPSAMIIDGTEVEVTATYQFDTVGEHIVNYSFADNQIPDNFMSGGLGDFTHLVGIKIGDALTSIGDYAFYDCSSNLTSCTIGSGVTTIGDYAFYDCSDLTSIIIPDSVTSIGDYAFYNCSSITSCTIGSGVTSIGSDAFEGCSSLTSIVIPSGVTSIGASAFNGCSSLTSVDIPSGVTSIGGGAFYNCSSLTSCTIGSGVTSIGSYAFYNCSSLTDITSNAMTAPTLGYGVLDSVNNNGVLTVPSGSQGYCGWFVELPHYWTIEGVTCE